MGRVDEKRGHGVLAVGGEDEREFIIELNLPRSPEDESDFFLAERGKFNGDTKRFTGQPTCTDN